MTDFKPAPIRYRVWDGERMRTDDGYTLAPDGSPATVPNDGPPSGSVYQPPVVMLSTGLRDADGVDVFDGDIVVADWHWTEPHVVTLPDDWYAFFEYLVVPPAEAGLRVVGNVYEGVREPA